MKPVKLEIENFLSYRGSHGIDFSELDFFVIVGGTGAGKSSLIEAICFALFGEVPRGLEPKDLINQTEQYMRVRFSFSFRGERFSVERAVHKRKGQEAILKTGGQKFYGVTRVNEKISSILGLGFETFTKVVHLPQGMFDRFLKPVKAVQRRQMLLDILGYSAIFKKLSELVKEEYIQKQTKLEDLKKIQEKYQDIDGESLQDIRENIKNKKHTLEQLDKERQKLEKLLEICRERDRLYREKQTIINSLQELESSRLAYEYNKKLYQIVKLLNGHVDKFSQIQDLERKLQQDMLKLEQVARSLQDVKTSLERKKSELYGLEEQLLEIEEEREKSGDIKLAIDKFKILEKKQFQIWELRIHIAECFRKLEEDENEKQTALNKEEKLKDRLNRLNEIAKERGKVIILKEVERDLQESSYKLKQARGKIEELSWEIENLESNLKELSNELEVLSQKRQTLDREVKRLKSEKDEILKELKRLEDLSDRIRILESAENIARELRGIRKTLFQKSHELEEVEKSLKKEKEEGALEYLAFEIRSLLSEGERCPVCGGEFHLELRSSSDLEYRKTDLLDKLINTYQSLKAEVGLLRSRLGDLREKLRSYLHGLERVRLKAARRMLKELPSRLAKVSEQERLQIVALEEINLQIEKLNQESNTKKIALEQKRALKESLKESINDLDRKCQDAEDKMASILEELCQLTGEGFSSVEEVSMYFEKLIKDIDQESKNLEAIKDAIANMEKQEYALRERIEGLRKQELNELAGLEALQGELTEILQRCGIETENLATSEDLERRLWLIEKTFTNLKNHKLKLEEDIRVLEEKEHSLESQLVALNTQIRGYQDMLSNLKSQLKNYLGHLSQEDINLGLKNVDRLNALEHEINNFTNRESTLRENLEKLEREISNIGQPEETSLIEIKIRQIRDSIMKIAQEIGNLEAKEESARKSIEEKTRLEEEIKTLERETEILKKVKNDITSDNFPEFISSMLMNDLVNLANNHMLRLSAGSYSMEFEGGEVIVKDLLNNKIRNSKTLSGGETFLASLSLAFALSDMISAQSAIECLFIDEGFGTLDKSARERVGSFLNDIKQNANRMVGIITHMEDIAELFTKRLIIKKTSQGSKIEAEPETALIEKPFEFNL
ncbi:MAG: AAA family ATPase [Aquificaceae bacterium]